MIEIPHTCRFEFDEKNLLLKVECPDCIHGKNIEDCRDCMAAVIDKLMEIKQITRIVVMAEREYEYSFEEARLLLEIAFALIRIQEGKIVSIKNVIRTPECDACVPDRLNFLRRLLDDIRFDPLAAYHTIIREIRHEKIKIKKIQSGERVHEQSIAKNDTLCALCINHYIENSLVPLMNILDECKLIQMGKNAEYKERSFYRKIFNPTARPTFMYTRFNIMPPANAQLIDRYSIEKDVEIEIYKIPDSVRMLYQMNAPEFKLNSDEYSLLDTARRYLGRHAPGEAEITEIQKFRENIYNISLDLLREVAKTTNVSVNENQLKRLANILARYTAGLGVLEIFLADEKVQDVLINSPIGNLPVFLFHGDHQECETNIIPSNEDAESWATRFRMQSGRPLDEANPVLDTEITVAGGRARVAAISRPLSVDGLGFAFRRHRDKPWTFPLFIKTRMLDSFSAGLMWFMIDGARTILIAGTRGSGKSSFLGSCMVQIMPKIRQLVVEDTLELPGTALRDLGFNIERMKSRSVITRVETELPAEEALRTALRLGDSALILGEVRSMEALALFEAMRIGALANVVAGTIHGASAFGVFDRVVNDLKVPPTSFKAMDLILICNTLRSPDMIHMYRRVTGLTEVRKHWKDDPMLEGGFVDLLEYSAKDDMLKPTKTLLMGESEILNDIASRVREWKSNWEAVWDSIQLRTKILQTIVDYSSKNPNILEAEIVSKSNSQFHIISDVVKREVGGLDSKMIYERWLKWLKGNL